MKKIALYILVFILICFIIPIIFTNNKIQNVSKEITNENEITPNTYDYKNYKTIKLLHSSTGQIEELNLDDYLYGVVASEMPANFELEALKAQAVVARTYTIYKIINDGKKHEGANICDNSNCCQAWITKEDRLARWEENVRDSNWNKIVEAVNSTQGKIITYEGKPINAFFHSNSGGTTETTANVWGGTGYPYLQSVETSGEDTYSQYSSEVTLTKKNFIDKIKEKHANFEIDFNVADCIKILEYTEGNRVKKVKIGNLELSGVEVRTILGLKSANFTVTIEGENIKFKVTGYGHGVGMSQTGADSMAKSGSNYEEIIKHFYTGVEITNM
ncbi:MAG: stage II sporulation protein D [Clostridia bacterium]|nr:stage II sporulation protein D [Clostridia bacterium]